MSLASKVLYQALQQLSRLNIAGSAHGIGVLQVSTVPSAVLILWLLEFIILVFVIRHSASLLCRCLLVLLGRSLARLRST